MVIDQTEERQATSLRERGKAQLAERRARTVVEEAREKEQLRERRAESLRCNLRDYLNEEIPHPSFWQGEMPYAIVDGLTFGLSTWDLAFVVRCGGDECNELIPVLTNFTPDRLAEWLEERREAPRCEGCRGEAAAPRAPVREPTQAAWALLRELRSYLDLDQCGAMLCICGIPDADPCPLHEFLRRMDAALEGAAPVREPWRVDNPEGAEELQDTLNECERDGYAVHNVMSSEPPGWFVVVARIGEGGER